MRFFAIKHSRKSGIRCLFATDVVRTLDYEPFATDVVITLDYAPFTTDIVRTLAYAPFAADVA